MRRALIPACLLLCLGVVTRSGGQAARPAPAADVTLTREPALSAGVRAAARSLPGGVRLGVLVRDLGSGEVLEASLADDPFIPASTIKLVTAAAVLADRGSADGWWSAELTVPAAQAGAPSVKAVSLRGNADPTLSAAGGPYSLRALAKQAYARGVRQVGEVRVDTAALNAGAWSGAVIGVPMTAPRLAEWHDTPPGSAQAARDRIGAALIAELRRAGVRVTSDTVGEAARPAPYVPPARTDDQGRPLPPDPAIPLQRRPEVGVASVRSASPLGVLAETLRPSDNLRAEELLATLAARPGGSGTLAGALARERALLRRLGADLSGVTLADGSGLSRENRLTPRALAQLLKAMYDLPYPRRGGSRKAPAQVYAGRLNAYAEALPQAGTGETTWRHDGRGGTLAQRLMGTGLEVRAKTGTLPGVSSLAGYVTGRSGRPLAFVIFMNGPESTPILTLRDVQDRMVQAIAEAH